MILKPPTWRMKNKNCKGHRIICVKQSIAKVHSNLEVIKSFRKVLLGIKVIQLTIFITSTIIMRKTKLVEHWDIVK
jgi:hypothetical protein